jgi:hypothetical protein
MGTDKHSAVKKERLPGERFFVLNIHFFMVQMYG